MKVAVAGASGYAGTELLRLLAAHPQFEVAVATGRDRDGEPLFESTPSLRGAYPDLVYSAHDPASLDGVDVAFLALPHGESSRLVPALAGRVGTVIDLAADFRLDASTYAAAYGEPHVSAQLLAAAVYGLPEWDRGALDGATLVAAAGCYPTAATLALMPFARAGLLEGEVIVDAASGISGAGRAMKDHLHFGEVDSDFSAYGLEGHRHTPEMERNLGRQIMFTPHLAPMSRGILATCYAKLADPTGFDSMGAMDLLSATYGAEPFVQVVPISPSTKATLGSNSAHCTARVDQRTGWLVALCAIDNLGKGAAGQAIQCANVVCGLEETTGLPTAGIYP